jgi:hypothetical protein
MYPAYLVIERRGDKTGAVIDHPLEEKLVDGSTVKFYEDAESILANLGRRGLPMILREVDPGVSKPYSFSGMQKIVQRMGKEIGLPVEFTLDARRHGGMTELEEAELTEGQGRALSAHRTRESYAGYAKRTAPRMLSATRKRHAHWLANQSATTVQNATDHAVQNEKNQDRQKQLISFEKLWLGREGSNLRMAESKSAALPLGYAPTGLSASAGP